MSEPVLLHMPCSKPDCDLCGFDDLMRFSYRGASMPEDVFCLPGSGEGAHVLRWSLFDYMARRPRIQ